MACTSSHLCLQGKRKKTPGMCQRMAECLFGGQGVPGEVEVPNLRDKHRIQLHFPTVMRTRCGKAAGIESKELIFPGWQLPPAMAGPSLAQQRCLAGCSKHAGINAHGLHCRARQCALLQKEQCSLSYGNQVTALAQHSCRCFGPGFCSLPSMGVSPPAWLLQDKLSRHVCGFRSRSGTCEFM